jgi:hypothetical protein
LDTSFHAHLFYSQSNIIFNRLQCPANSHKFVIVPSLTWKVAKKVRRYKSMVSKTHVPRSIDRWEYLQLCQKHYQIQTWECDNDTIIPYSSLSSVVRLCMNRETYGHNFSYLPYTGPNRYWQVYLAVPETAIVLNF